MLVLSNSALKYTNFKIAIIFIINIDIYAILNVVNFRAGLLKTNISDQCEILDIFLYICWEPKSKFLGVALNLKVVSGVSEVSLFSNKNGLLGTTILMKKNFFFKYPNELYCPFSQKNLKPFWRPTFYT